MGGGAWRKRKKKRFGIIHTCRGGEGDMFVVVCVWGGGVQDPQTSTKERERERERKKGEQK